MQGRTISILGYVPTQSHYQYGIRNTEFEGRVRVPTVPLQSLHLIGLLRSCDLAVAGIIREWLGDLLIANGIKVLIQAVGYIHCTRACKIVEVEKGMSLFCSHLQVR